MRKGIVLVAVILCGCATQRLNSGLQKVMGESVDVLVSAWGYPEAQREIMGQKLYIWSNDNGMMAIPLNGGGVYAGRLTCTIQVGVNASNVMTTYQWNGNNGGCASFARRLP